MASCTRPSPVFSAQFLALFAAGVDILHQGSDALLTALRALLRRLLMLFDGGEGTLDVLQLRLEALALGAHALDALRVRGALVLHGLELRFGAGAGDLLAVQFVVQFAALLLEARALGLLPHQFVAGGDHFIVQFAQALCAIPRSHGRGRAGSSPATARCRRSSSRRSA